MKHPWLKAYQDIYSDKELKLLADISQDIQQPIDRSSKLIINGHYTISPLLDHDTYRVEKLTREVKILAIVHSEYILIEELSDGPYNHWGKNNLLWCKGDRSIKEFSEWDFKKIIVA